MSERIYDIKDLRVVNRMTIELDDPQQLRDLANRLEAATKDRTLPGEVSIEITPSIEIRYNPNKNRSTIPFRNFHGSTESNTSEDLLR